MAHKKMDPLLIAAKQPHELKYVEQLFKAPAHAVTAAIAQVGKGRRKVYDELRRMGFTKQLKKK